MSNNNNLVHPKPTRLSAHLIPQKNANPLILRESEERVQTQR